MSETFALAFPLVFDTLFLRLLGVRISSSVVEFGDVTVQKHLNFAELETIVALNL